MEETTKFCIFRWKKIYNMNEIFGWNGTQTKCRIFAILTDLNYIISLNTTPPLTGTTTGPMLCVLDRRGLPKKKGSSKSPTDGSETRILGFPAAGGTKLARRCVSRTILSRTACSSWKRDTPVLNPFTFLMLCCDFQTIAIVKPIKKAIKSGRNSYQYMSNFGPAIHSPCPSLENWNDADRTLIPRIPMMLAWFATPAC